ncbi:Intracellular septation protein [Usitatibacter rugosus]|uniref:Inner membrane-spanning protein YciB n=1 Tax=Usitatibacter rugosus TaxID=2732067 RepID=A0A6M4GSV0_9PROT|nr:septation protein A [Usitatibacter rugosus]QJR09918.1 Intracellular septation protein [Usitatibacter rugosus]
MKFLFDFFPVILFFVAFKFSDIFVATGVAMAAAIAQIAYMVVRHRKVTPMQWASIGIIVVFGGATLLLHDETFIKWKPTVLYGLMGLSFLGSLAFGKNLIKAVMAENMELPEPVWFKLCVAWGVFFLFKAALNLWVAYTFSTDTWVNFKLFGGMGLIFAFVIAQAFWISRYLPDDPPAPPVEKAP